jgi:hypothetical protein
MASDSDVTVDEPRGGGAERPRRTVMTPARLAVDESPAAGTTSGGGDAGAHAVPAAQAQARARGAGGQEVWQAHDGRRCQADQNQCSIPQYLFNEEERASSNAHTITEAKKSRSALFLGLVNGRDEAKPLSRCSLIGCCSEVIS